MEKQFSIVSVSKSELCAITGDIRAQRLSDEEMENFVAALSEEYYSGSFVDEVRHIRPR